MRLKIFFKNHARNQRFSFYKNPLKRSKRFESIKNLNPHISILPQLKLIIN